MADDAVPIISSLGIKNARVKLATLMSIKRIEKDITNLTTREEDVNQPQHPPPPTPAGFLSAFAYFSAARSSTQPSPSPSPKVTILVKWSGFSYAAKFGDRLGREGGGGRASDSTPLWSDGWIIAPVSAHTGKEVDRLMISSS